MTAVTRQAAAAAQSHAAHVKELEEKAEGELSRVKSEASSAITALMQENARLKTLLALPGGTGVAPGPPALAPLPSLRSRQSAALAGA